MKSMGPRCSRVCRPVADRLRNRSDALTGVPDMLGYVCVASEMSVLMKSNGARGSRLMAPLDCVIALMPSLVLIYYQLCWPTLTGCVIALCPSLGCVIAPSQALGLRNRSDSSFGRI